MNTRLVRRVYSHGKKERSIKGILMANSGTESLATLLCGASIKIKDMDDDPQSDNDQEDR